MMPRHHVGHVRHHALGQVKGAIAVGLGGYFPWKHVPWDFNISMVR